MKRKYDDGVRREKMDVIEKLYEGINKIYNELMI